MVLPVERQTAPVLNRNPIVEFGQKNEARLAVRRSAAFMLLQRGQPCGLLVRRDGGSLKRRNRRAPFAIQRFFNDIPATDVLADNEYFSRTRIGLAEAYQSPQINWRVGPHISPKSVVRNSCSPAASRRQSAAGWQKCIVVMCAVLLAERRSTSGDHQNWRPTQ